ncbi:MAG: hypothetical protein ABI645_02680 [Pseudomonadota bacterium]
MSAPRAVQYLAAGHTQTYLASPEGVQPGEAQDGATMVAVVDSADELYTTVSPPAVGRGYMKSLMQRRLEREFPECSLRTTLPIPRRRGDGQSEVVMIAVAADAALNAHLAELGDRFALRAVVTPSLLVCAWMKRAGISPRRVLVVLPTPAGLRLVFVENGVPSLSRLMPPVDVGGSTATEIARTIQYLQNTQRVDRNEPLELWFWGLGADQIPACLPAGVPYVLGTTLAPAHMTDPVHDGFDALLALAAHHFNGAQLVRDQLRLGWLARETVRLSRYAAAALLVLCAAASGVMYWQMQGVQHDTGQFTVRIDAINSDHTALEQQLADRKLKLEDIRVLPDTEHAIRASEVQLQEMLDVAGMAFGTNESLHLQSLEFASAPTVASSSVAERSCDGESLPRAPSAQMVFSLTEGLEVRSRTAALQVVRGNLDKLGSWKPTRRSASVGAEESLSIAAGVEPPVVTTEWTACLSRGEAAS